MKMIVSSTLLGLVFHLVCGAGCTSKPASVSSGNTSDGNTSEVAVDKPLAFPGAEGFGKYTTGGRGGQVVYVTNLNDDGEGSLRDAIQKKGPRVIVFAVSGTIPLERPLDINNGDVTIAGQTAPGDGIAIRNFPVSIKADNVILRYLRFRMGDTAGQQADALGANKGNNNIIVDHCSMSWATDECASFYRGSNFTLQWSIISESLNSSVHSKGDHGYGGIWGGEGATFHHNLLASHNSRNPRFSGSSTTPNSEKELVDFRNNVIFNWKSNSIYGGEKGKYNVVDNYFKAGPATQKSRRNRIINPSQPYGRFYVAGNYVDGFSEITKDNWAGGVQCEHPDSTRADKVFTGVNIPSQKAQQAYEQVLAYAGASHKRDAVDARIVSEVKNGNPSNGKNKNGIIDSQEEVGSWPELKATAAPKDSDKDGMPDVWEAKQKLNPNSSEDASKYTLDKQYTNIEVYINSLVATDQHLN